MAVKNVVLAIPLGTIAIAGTYAAFAALPQACFLIRIINGSNAGVTVSYDGVTDNDFVLAADSLQLPMQSNSQPNNFTANVAKGSIIYVKGTGAGNVYLAGYYQPSVN